MRRNRRIERMVLSEFNFINLARVQKALDEVE